MGSEKQREQRRIVFLRARMRATSEWCDATICNVSSRGLMVKSASPPTKGMYIELRHQSVCIIGRVVWSHGSRFGVRTQDAIDISSLLAEPSAKAKRSGEERRLREREGSTAAERPNFHLHAEASRRFARIFDWAALVIAVLVAAGFVFEGVTASLAPMQQAKQALTSTARE